jgi:hypothetical protein
VNERNFLAVLATPAACVDAGSEAARLPHADTVAQRLASAAR